MNAIDIHLVRARQALLNATAVVPHTDADGLAAAAIALRARGERADAAVLLRRGEHPFQTGIALPDGPLAILDWGVRELARPGVLVDHHIPEAAPRPDQVVVSSYGEAEPVPTAALMRRVVPDAPAWLAAVGSVGDLGQAAFSLPECEGAPRAAVRRLAGLVNAPRRCPDGPVRTALAILVENEDAGSALLDRRVEQLEEAKRRWRAEFDRVMRTAPRVGRSAALVRFSSPCQVHAPVAQTWSRRLAPRVVIAANDGYLEGRVNFAVRGGTGSLPALLRAALPDAGGEYAHGHDRATGGSVDPADFERLLDALGVAS